MLHSTTDNLTVPPIYYLSIRSCLRKSLNSDLPGQLVDRVSSADMYIYFYRNTFIFVDQNVSTTGNSLRRKMTKTEIYHPDFTHIQSDTCRWVTGSFWRCGFGTSGMVFF